MRHCHRYVPRVDESTLPDICDAVRTDGFVSPQAPLSNPELL